MKKKNHNKAFQQDASNAGASECGRYEASEIIEK
jgi:hypothetical protein